MKLPAAAAAGAALALVGAVLATAAVGSPAAKTTVKVTEREYALSFSPRTLAPGPVTFSVKNAGRVAHALAVSGPGLKTVRTRSIAPGKTASITVTLGRGTFTLWCPLGRHAAAGMKTTFRVGSGPLVPVPTTTNPAPPPYDPGDGY
jgi:plastocyanin